MFYKVMIKDAIRVPPAAFGEKKETAVIQNIKKKFEGFISKDIGIVIDVLGITEIGSGVIIPGDGAVYYATSFELIVYQADMQEVIVGKIKDIADFGAFISLGPIDGMVHIGQAMDDFVSLSGDKTLTGKDSKRVLKVGDKCRARLIAVSFKDISNPKFGLTMRQELLGKIDWLSEDGKSKDEAKPATETKKESKAKAK